MMMVKPTIITRIDNVFKSQFMVYSLSTSTRISTKATLHGVCKSTLFLEFSLLSCHKGQQYLFPDSDSPLARCQAKPI